MKHVHISQMPAEDGRAACGGPAPKQITRRLWKLSRKYAQNLGKSFRLACDGNDDGVHDLRVATRRLQAIVELLDPERRGKKAKELRRNLKALRHAVGEERDLRLFAQSARRRARRSTTPARRRVWRQIAADLAAEFTAASKHARKRLQQRAPAVLAQKIKRALQKNGSKIDTGQNATAIENARWKLAASIREAETPHAVSGYHNVRIKAKSLRYLLEIRANIALSNADNGLINLLKSVQDELGDWHDEVELCRRATATLSADADRQADAEATAVLEAIRGRSGVINQHAREVAGRLRDALGLDGLKAHPAPAHRRSPRTTRADGGTH